MIKFSKYKHGDELLNLLAMAHDFVPIPDMMASLKLSRRTLFYLIKKVNEELDTNELFAITNIKNVGYYLPEDTLLSLQTKSKINQLSGLSPHERLKIIAFLLVTRPFSSLSYLSNFLCVSRNTIIRDLSQVEKELAQKQIKIINSKKGKALIGSEINKRQYIYENADELIRIYSSHISMSINRSVPKQLKLLEKITGNLFTDDAKEMFDYYITWYLKRVQNVENQLPATKSADDYSLTYTWANSLLQDNKVNNNAEAAYLVKIVNSRQFSFVNWDDPLIKKLRPITNKMIQRFNEVAGVSINPQENSLINNLTVHLLSTYYRVKFNINYVHPDLKQIKETYQETFDLTQLAVEPFEKFLSKKISDDEVALIALYFGAVLRNAYSSRVHSGQVLVVCSSGIGTSQLLLKQLRSVYPAISFAGPLNVIQYENSALDDAKLIITTIRLHQRKNIPIINVPAFPSNSEWNKINSALISSKLISKDTNAQLNIGTLMDIITTYSKVIDFDGLKGALRNYISKSNQKAELLDQFSQEKHRLQLTADDILFITKTNSWEQVLRSSLSPLLEKQEISSHYINTIIQLLKKHGPYMVLGNGIMLAHASPKDGVNKLGISLSLLKQKIRVGTPSKPVKLIVGLAPVDEKQHLSFLGLLMKQFQNEEWLKKLYTISNRTDLIKELGTTKLLK